MKVFKEGQQGERETRSAGYRLPGGLPMSGDRIGLPIHTHYSWHKQPMALSLAIFAHVFNVISLTGKVRAQHLSFFPPVMVHAKKECLMLELSVSSPVLEHFHYLQTRFSPFSLNAFDSSKDPFRNHRVTLP